MCVTSRTRAPMCRCGTQRAIRLGVRAECIGTDQYRRSSDGKQATVAPQPAQEAGPPAVPEVNRPSLQSPTPKCSTALDTQRLRRNGLRTVLDVSFKLCVAASATLRRLHRQSGARGLCSAGKLSLPLRSGHLPQPRGGPHTASHSRQPLCRVLTCHQSEVT